MPDRRVVFHFKEFFDCYGAVGTDATEIVADEIHDHDVFRTVLWIVAKPLGDLPIFSGCTSAALCALHGLRRDAARGPAVINPKEKLRRKGKDVSARLALEEGAIVHRLCTAKSSVERRWAIRNIGANRECEVELINLARTNPLVNPCYAIGELLLREPELDVRHPVELFRSRFQNAGRNRVEEVAGGVVKTVATIVDPKPSEQVVFAAQVKVCGRLLLVRMRPVL